MSRLTPTIAARLAKVSLMVDEDGRVVEEPADTAPHLQAESLTRTDAPFVGSSTQEDTKAALSDLVFAAAGSQAPRHTGAPGTGGVRVVSAGGSLPDANTPGFCYLRTVRPDAREKIRKALGRNPYFSEVVAWLQRNVSEHTAVRLAITYGSTPLDMHGQPAFIQAHIEECASGARLKQILNLPSVDVRLGADRQGPTSVEAGGLGRASREVSVQGARTRVTIPFALTLKHNSGAVSFSPRTSPTIVALTKYFESAQLVDFVVSASVGGGQSAVLGIGFSASASAPADVDGFLVLPYMTMVAGTENSLGRGDFGLPPEHGFGREVKALALGNADPVVHFRLDKDTASFAHIRGHVVLDLAGVGVPAPIVITPAIR